MLGLLSLGSGRVLMMWLNTTPTSFPSLQSSWDFAPLLDSLSIFPQRILELYKTQPEWWPCHLKLTEDVLVTLALLSSPLALEDPVAPLCLSLNHRPTRLLCSVSAFKLKPAGRREGAHPQHPQVKTPLLWGGCIQVGQVSGTSVYFSDLILELKARE